MRTAGPKIALRFLRLSVCLFMRLHLSRAQYNVIHYYTTAVCSSFWRFIGQGTANEGRCVLPRLRKLRRHP